MIDRGLVFFFPGPGELYRRGLSPNSMLHGGRAVVIGNAGDAVRIRGIAASRGRRIHAASVSERQDGSGRGRGAGRSGQRRDRSAAAVCACRAPAGAQSELYAGWRKRHRPCARDDRGRAGFCRRRRRARFGRGCGLGRMCARLVGEIERTSTGFHARRDHPRRLLGRHRSARRMPESRAFSMRWPGATWRSSPTNRERRAIWSMSRSTWRAEGRSSRTRPVSASSARQGRGDRDRDGACEARAAPICAVAGGYGRRRSTLATLPTDAPMLRSAARPIWWRPRSGGGRRTMISAFRPGPAPVWRICWTMIGRRAAAARSATAAISCRRGAACGAANETRGLPDVQRLNHEARAGTASRRAAPGRGSARPDRRRRGCRGCARRHLLGVLYRQVTSRETSHAVAGG